MCTSRSTPHVVRQPREVIIINQITCSHKHTRTHISYITMYTHPIETARDCDVYMRNYTSIERSMCKASTFWLIVRFVKADKRLRTRISFTHDDARNPHACRSSSCIRTCDTHPDWIWATFHTRMSVAHTLCVYVCSYMFVSRPALRFGAHNREWSSRLACVPHNYPVCSCVFLCNVKMKAMWEYYMWAYAPYVTIIGAMRDAVELIANVYLTAMYRVQHDCTISLFCHPNTA